MRFLGFLIAVVSVLGMSWSDGAQAGISSFMDANGVIHFTNVPSDPRYVKMVPVSYRAPAVTARVSPRTPKFGRFPEHFVPLVEEAALEHSIDGDLLKAVITAESGYDPQAVSSKGAVGLMQLMPETARRYGVRNLYDPAQNIRGGAQYLRDLMRKYNNDLSLTLAAYNAGEQAVVRYGNRIPPFRETRLYVPRVIGLYQQYQLSSRYKLSSR
mgnify:FL=1